MLFKKTPLGDFADVQGGYAFKSKDLQSEGFCPVVKIKNVRDGFLSLNDVTYVNKELASQTTRFLCETGDVLISMTGSGPNAPDSMVGRVARVKDSDLPALLNQRVGKLVIREKGSISQNFLYYCLSSKSARNYLVSSATGSANQANINADTIKSLQIPKISYKESVEIGEFLSTFDDKIELNKKMSQTLEEIAKAIFKSWFVDFDPVRAKAEGRPTGLPPEISDLFPDELVDSEIGEIPKGWDVKPADALFDMSIGRTPPRKETQWFSTSETDVPWVSIRDMGDCGTFIGRTSEYLTHDAVGKHRMRKLPTGSVLLSFKLTVGRVSVTTKEMTTNEAIAHFPPSNVFPYTNYTYFYLNGFRYESLGSTSSIATAMNSKMVKAIPFIVATPDLLEKFEVTVALMMDRVRLASEEMHILSELRDTLIPKLISGELRIPDAEKFLEEAGI